MFTPLVFTTTGGMGREASTFYKRLVSMLSHKREKPYSMLMGWLRCRLSFTVIRSAIMCVRGTRSSFGRPVNEEDLTLASTEGQVPYENIEHLNICIYICLELTVQIVLFSILLYEFCPVPVVDPQNFLAPEKKKITLRSRGNRTPGSRVATGCSSTIAHRYRNTFQLTHMPREDLERSRRSIELSQQWRPKEIEKTRN